VRRSSLLFVDDEEGFLELYRAAFSREGYVVETAATIPEARTRVANGEIGLVVLDIRLGVESGLSFLRELKASQPRLPVILSTAYARYQDDFSSWLADAYVVKSSDLAELRRTVTRCMEGA
jgi:DNA-binding NtrC family response regulator